MRTIAVFTACRAEYGLLRPLLLCLRQGGACTLKLLISGTHLSPAHGYTLREIEADGFAADAAIPLDLSNGSAEHLCLALGTVVSGVGAALAKIKPDIFVLLGDRYECLGAATAAAMLRVPVAHIHGGEITQGAMDDAFRHAVTKLSCLHFPACEAYRQRIIQLGETPDRVWNVGALGVENVNNIALLDESHIRNFLTIPDGVPYFLCTFHPTTLEPGQEAQQLTSLLNALEYFPDYHIVMTGTNADPGGNTLNSMLYDCANCQKRIVIYQSLGVLRYLSAAKYAACVVGNSSSGIVEIPSLGTPVVNVGDRQKGRIASSAVLHCRPNADDLVAILRQALTAEHRQLASDTPNPYEKAGTSTAIAKILHNYPLTGILKKIFYDIKGQ